MRFVSTRGGGGEVSFKEAVFSGLAPDGGLYYPSSGSDLESFFHSLRAGTGFNQLAEEVTYRLFTGELDRAGAKRIVGRAFTFIPVLKTLDEGLHLLELFHGPTCAFKDYGAAFLASVMEDFLKEEGRRIVILTATSGDTGGAVARAFFKKKNIEVVLLYPSGRVSPLQEKQLTTLGENITALEVKGSFDDCQRMVKKAFLDRDLKESLKLTSANSINLGRLIPQSFYYMYAAGMLNPADKKNAGSVFFCVPSGNFGNLTAGVYAWQWGLPVKGFIAATNVNDVVPEYLATGVFKPRPSRETLSTAMDVGNPSNFERLKTAFRDDPAEMRRMIRGERVTDRETREMIGEAYRRYHCLVDPHTAVGLAAAREFLKGNPGPAGEIIILATAHPGKFVETVTAATGFSPELPESLKVTLDLPGKSIPMGSSSATFSSFLKEKYL